MDNISYFISLFPKYLSDIINSFEISIRNQINEIRLRRNNPIILYIRDRAYFVELSGSLSKKLNSHCIRLSSSDFDLICDRICNNSYHTNMSTLTEGYVTTKNGSRVGVASTAVLKDGQIHSVKDICSLNIRISHEYRNCSKVIIDLICKNNKLPGIIVAGKPASGKTTFLRDYARLISDGYTGEYKKVAIVDERKEIASSFDVGVNTDVLYGFAKAKGIEMATRTLSPDLIICDEIGNIDELNAIINGFSCGVSFAVSVHIKDEKQIFSNSILLNLIETNQFDYIVILKSYTQEFEIIDLGEIKLESRRNDHDNPFFFLPWSDGC